MRFVKKIFQITALASGIYLISGSMAFAANLSLLTPTGVYQKGQKITVSVEVTKNTQSVNAFSGELSFPSDLLAVSSLSKTGSIITMWAEEPSYSNTAGTIDFEGVVLGGFDGDRGKILSITFTVKKTGQASVLFSSGSVLANDGKATNVVELLSGTTLTLMEGDQNVTSQSTSPSSVSASPSAPVVVSTSHPDVSKWYSLKSAKLSWSVPDNVTSLRILLDQSPNSIPTSVYSNTVTQKTFTIEKDGIYYFHIQFKNNIGWGAITHFPLKIDTTKPDLLEIKLVSGGGTTNSHPTFTFSAHDTFSGVARFLVKIDNNEIEEVPYIGGDKSYTSPALVPGNHTMVVHVEDNAGNSSVDTLDFKTLSLDVPVITSYSEDITTGDEVSISGKTYPGSTVEVLLISSREGTYRKSVMSDNRGLFTAIIDDSLSASKYTMQARVINQNGDMSVFTEPKTVKVSQSKLITIGSLVINWSSLLLILLLLALSCAALVWYFMVRFVVFRRTTKHMLLLKETLLEHDIEAIIDDLAKNHSMLLKISKKRDLTEEEEAMLKQFKRHLKITEDEIGNKLAK